MSQETVDSTAVTVEPISKPAAGPTEAQLQAQQLQEAQALQVCNGLLVFVQYQFQNCAGYDGRDGGRTNEENCALVLQLSR